MAALTPALAAAPRLKPEPRIQFRPAQAYVAIRSVVAMKDLDLTIRTGIPRVFGWIAGHRVAPAGPPFTRYRVISMPSRLEVEVGVPVVGKVTASSPVQSGSFPVGRYADYIYTGSYQGLESANAAIQSWAAQKHIKLDRHDTRVGVAWGARAEFYMTDPRTQPDPNKQRTEIVYLIAPQK